ncbi:hypothetical protein O2K51_08180 [Apibacter raozihei]|uniref:hypothetical protein n=1 Tax=Apibacter raozihei TaxID=2500547 RepID=UPI000FE39FB6|nr:hypothetical protein [Apibacter raozihei]
MNIDSKTTIYIICPANSSTGGPEALHQLSHKLRTVLKYNAQMVYINKKSNKSPKPSSYTIYDTKEALEVIDDKNNILIIPESLTHYVSHYPNIQKIIWWLSVDFYEICKKNRHRGLKFYFSKYIVGKKEEIEYGLENRSDVFHWAQSYRSYLYLLDKGVLESKIDRVCDYMNPVFTKKAILQGDISKIKEDIIIYNPKKGKKQIDKIKNYNLSYQWIPIEKMTPEEVSEIMKKSKLYIDFGYNPGRDRMLRESALMDCAIISGKGGSSKYQEDLNIPEKYKFEYSESLIPQINESIEFVMNNYSSSIKDFIDYKEQILNEESNFEKQLKSIF